MPCRKLGTVARYFVLSWVLLATVATAQEQGVKPLVRELEQRQTAMASVHTLQRLSARIFYVESVALLSEYGAWPEEAHNWTQGQSVSKFVYDVFNIHVRFTSELAQLRRTASRKGVFTDEERERFASMLDDLALMIDHSQQLYDLLDKDQMSEASQFFRNSIREPYDRIAAEGYTIGSGISRDIRRISLAARKVD